jgi:isoleucyl-tRNA synthetase
MEEVWGHLNQTGSVHTAYFPELSELMEGIGAESRKRVENWNRLVALREPVSKSLETARQEKIIGSSLEASVRISADAELYPLLNQYENELPGLFIVSQVDVRNHADAGVKVTIDRARGTKCERCWKYTEDVGSVAEIPTVCAACAAAIQEIPPHA